MATPRLRDPGWTPGARDIPSLLDLMRHEDDDEAEAAEKALLRIDARQRPAIAQAAVAVAREAVRPARGRLTRLLGRIAKEADEARAFLVEAVRDADPKTRRTAARALGKLPASKEVEAALLAAWDATDNADDRRSLAEPLGKIGSAAARERLAGTSQAKDDRKVARAALIAEREGGRDKRGEIALHAAMPEPIVVRLHARTGLERVVIEELGETWRPRMAGPGVVEARLTGPLADATAIRTATHVGFPLDPQKIDGDVADAIVAALASDAAKKIFATYTRTEGAPVRFRLAWAGGGHKRGSVWRVAELVRDRAPELVNDPTESTWEVVVDVAGGFAAIELVPRGYADERFAYRTKTVPASSHPTLAAALARLLPRSAEDVVWDPFVGAGAELAERARLGPYARLVGTDRDADALEAARANLAGTAGVTLEQADATTYRPPDQDGRVNVIVTNPPMGRRVERGAHVDLLETFVAHAAAILPKGGVLVWTVPEPKRVHARAAREGLELERAWTVDMGGFPAALSIHKKR